MLGCRRFRSAGRWLERRQWLDDARSTCVAQRRRRHHTDRHGLSTHLCADAYERCQVFRRQRSRSARTQRHAESCRHASQRAEFVACRVVWRQRRSKGRSTRRIAVSHLCHHRQQQSRRLLLGFESRRSTRSRSFSRTVTGASESSSATRSVRIRFSRRQIYLCN